MKKEQEDLFGEPWDGRNEGEAEVPSTWEEGQRRYRKEVAGHIRELYEMYKRGKAAESASRDAGITGGETPPKDRNMIYAPPLIDLDDLIDDLEGKTIL